MEVEVSKKANGRASGKENKAPAPAIPNMSEEERTELGGKLIAALQAVDDLEAEKKLVVADLKDGIKSAKEVVKSLRAALRPTANDKQTAMFANNASKTKAAGTKPKRGRKKAEELEEV